MRQINVKFVIILVLVVLLGGGGLFALNRFQVSRNAGSLFTRAEDSLEAGNKSEALQLLSRYVGMRPNDATAYSMYAELLLEVAETPGAGRSAFSQAYSALETAVRKDPENFYLRQRLAQFQIFIDRPGDAREHLLWLRNRIAENPEAASESSDNTSDEKRVLTAGEIDVLLARALMGNPRLLLLDEPSLGLAPMIVQQIFEILRQIHQQQQTTILLVEQNARLALQLADRGYLLENGKIQLTDTAANLLDNEAVQRVYLGG